MDLEGVWVRYLQAGYRARAPSPVVVEARDGREEVRAGVLDPSFTFECPYKVFGRDGDVAQRRRVVELAPEMECPDKAVARHVGKLGGQVRLKVGPAVAVRVPGVGDEGSEQAAAKQLSGIECDVDLRIEAVRRAVGVRQFRACP